jgi:farnesyl diphosphate synthase
MSFERSLAEAALAVERHLRAWLAADASFVDQPCPVPDRLRVAIAHAVFSGGKRLRPLLVVESSRLFDVETEAALATAAALECVHCYSLVHDDLPAMDDDETRRGAPTVWKAFDEWTAVLAGDALLTLAFEILSALPGDIAAEVRCRLVGELARSAGPRGMVGGQCLDLEADKLGEPPAPDLRHILGLQEMKTGALMGFACRSGAILGRAPPAQEALLARFGRRLGLAFQIADDLLDAEGDAAVVGKATGKDAGRHKATLVALLGPDAARAKLAEVEAETIALLDMFGSRADLLRNAVRFAVRRQR